MVSQDVTLKRTEWSSISGFPHHRNIFTHYSLVQALPCSRSLVVYNLQFYKLFTSYQLVKISSYVCTYNDWILLHCMCGRGGGTLQPCTRHGPSNEARAHHGTRAQAWACHGPHTRAHSNNGARASHRIWPQYQSQDWILLPGQPKNHRLLLRPFQSQKQCFQAHDFTSDCQSVSWKIIGKETRGRFYR